MYILAFKNNNFVRAITATEENKEKLKDDCKQDFEDENLVFEEMTEVEFNAWLDGLPKPMSTPTEEQQRLTDLEMAMAEILGGGL